MKKDYFETEKQLDALIKKYSEFVVKAAISNLMRVGTETMTEEYVANRKNEIILQHEIAKAQGETPLVSSNIACRVVDATFELSKLNAFHIIAYMQEKLFFDVEQNTIPKERMDELLRKTLAVFDYYERSQNNESDSDVEFIEILIDECGFSEDEIEKLGFNEQLNKYFNAQN